MGRFKSRDPIAGATPFGFLLALLFLLVLSSPLLSAAAPPAAPAPSPEQLQRLIAALGDADYFVRQNAEAELGKIGFDAVEALTAATECDDMEVTTRAGRLLHKIRSNWTVAGEPRRVSQLLTGYEAQSESGREARIVQLVDLPEHQGFPAICRIVRYERSLVLAKTAALRMIEAMTNEPAEPDPAATLAKGLDNCQRAPARWVAAWLQARPDPQALVGIWTKFAAAEEELLFRQPRDTSLAVVESLLRRQIAALRKTGRGADAVGSIERLIKLRRGKPAELAELLQWLIEQEDWPATRLVEDHCHALIAESADLLYLLAEAQVGRGDAAAAEQSAGQALKLNPDTNEPSLIMHYQAGMNLEQRGRFAWATKEWERVIHNAPPHSSIGIITARSLAELYHDLDEDQQAAETLSGIEKAQAQRSNQWPLLNRGSSDAVTLGTLRARRDYFEACHWKARGDRAKQRECLDRALATQFCDIEVLIEGYQIPDSPDYHAKMRKLIEKKLCELREQIADLGSNPAAAEPCNNFAWLAANTEGDLDEALRLSKRSLDLVGQYGAYCDTLAQVYFAKGDYANALMQQTRAAKLMPHSHDVQKHLARFQKKACENGIKLEDVEKLEKAAPPLEKAVPTTEQEAPAEDDPFGFFKPLLPAHAHHPTSVRWYQAAC